MQVKVRRYGKYSNVDILSSSNVGQHAAYRQLHSRKTIRAAQTQQMLAATQKHQDFKHTKLRIFLCFCEKGGLQMTYTTGWATAVSRFRSRKEQNRCLLCAFFWVIPRRLNFICQRFGTLCSIFIGG